MQLRRRLFTIGLVLMTGTSFVLPVDTFAAENTCECYCNIEGTGATKFPDESTKVTADRCQELCREGGYSVAACAMDPSQKPQYNIMCFTPDECKSQGGISTATGVGTQTQPGECKQGMYYCYPDPSKRIKATLQVAIGGLTATGDLGEYISEVYKWMLGVGTTIAIVFMMVAGLRWTLGGANAEQIGKAKKTITNALVGLILLLSTYLIIYTVNPYLVRLQVPAFPMLKMIALLDSNKSCGFLSGMWGTKSYTVANRAPLDSPYAIPGLPYTVDAPKGTTCGSVANVTKDPQGNTVADDMTCTYDYCPEASDRCFPVSGSGHCLSCSDFADGGSAPMEATESICSAFSKTTIENKKIKSVERCTFYTDLTTLQALGITVGKDLPDLGEPHCYYQSTTCGTCADYLTAEACAENLCGLSCEWAQVVSSSPIALLATLTSGSCVPK